MFNSEFYWLLLNQRKVLFVCIFVIAGTGPTYLDLSAETLSWSSVLAQEEEGIGRCVQVYA